MGFSRQEYWSGLPFPSPGDLPEPETEPTSPTSAGSFFTTDSLGKPSRPLPKLSGTKSKTKPSLKLLMTQWVGLPGLSGKASPSEVGKWAWSGGCSLVWTSQDGILHTPGPSAERAEMLRPCCPFYFLDPSSSCRLSRFRTAFAPPGPSSMVAQLTSMVNQDSKPQNAEPANPLKP